MKKLILFLLILTSVVGCSNDSISFPDYDYSAVYFPYQFPVRTITFGEDIFDNTLDLQGKCEIMCALGGVYDNKQDRIIKIEIADTIPVRYNFTGTTRAIRAMPRNYYTLASDQIIIKKGSISGGVQVQLTDAFFADPLATANNYVIPLLMTTVTNADTILQGKPILLGSKPRRLNGALWDVRAKDYVLYAVKYINTWHGQYLRRGRDVYSGNRVANVVRRPVDVVTYDASAADSQKWVFPLTTQSLNVLRFPIVLQDNANPAQNYNCVLNLSFDQDNNCTVTSSDPSTYTATGSGKFVKKGEKQSFGGLDRDVLYLDYTITHPGKGITTQTKDTLVMRNRGVVMEQFSATLAP